jgi:hypothetical protein
MELRQLQLAEPRQLQLAEPRQLVGGLLQPLLVGDTLTPESQESFRRKSMAAAGFRPTLSSI